MRRALTSIVIIAFAGLLCTTLLAVFSGTHLGNQYVHKHQTLQYPYFMVY